MRILFLSNMYPPYVIGGYEALCQEIVEGLVERGHEAVVLTSDFGVGRPSLDGNVHRVLVLESDLQFYRVGQALAYPRLRQRNLGELRRLISSMQPDVVFVWGMWNLSRSLASEAEKLMGSRVVYYLANPWPIEPNMHQAYWDAPAVSSVGKLIKPMVRVPFRTLLREEWHPVQLRFEHAPCCSAAQRDELVAAGVSLQSAPVIYEGIDLAPYLEQAESRTFGEHSEGLSLLYVGILAPHKGVHTAIEALAHLTPMDREGVSLTIVGRGHPQYEARLRSLVEQDRLTDVVAFHAPIARSELPAFLGRYDVLVLPSVWSEPLARIMQEGLAAGMVVAGSATGGTKETIVDGENGLLFEAEDAAGLASIVLRLKRDRSLCARLSKQGSATAVDLFNIKVMVGELEHYLQAVVSGEQWP